MMFWYSHNLSYRRKFRRLLHIACDSFGYARMICNRLDLFLPPFPRSLRPFPCLCVSVCIASLPSCLPLSIISAAAVPYAVYARGGRWITQHTYALYARAYTAYVCYIRPGLQSVRMLYTRSHVKIGLKGGVMVPCGVPPRSTGLDMM